MAIDNLDQWSKSRFIPTPMICGLTKSYITPEPLGVALLMNAWNYPFNTLLPHLVSIIASGNVCLMKNTESAPFSSNVIKKII